MEQAKSAQEGLQTWPWRDKVSLRGPSGKSLYHQAEKIWEADRISTEETEKWKKIEEGMWPDQALPTEVENGHL